jgi:hypothetical protein
MVVRGGGDVADHPGAGLQDGGQVGSVLAGRQHATVVEGVGPGGWVEGPEGVRVGISPENAGTLTKQLSRQLIPVLRIRDVYPRSRILIFSHPRFRIQKQQQKRGVKKNLLS